MASIQTLFGPRIIWGWFW